MEYGFVQSYADYSIFTHDKGGKYMDLLVYVDDLVLTGNDAHTCAQFKTYLSKCFHIKDLGALKYFLGVEEARGPTWLFLCQCKYALEIIDECRMLGSKPVEFLMETNHKLALAIGKPLADATQYRRLIGRLIYLTLTRPELC